MKLFESASFSMIEKGLNVAAMRQNVLADNIANADTPNFKRSEVRFESFLQQELASSRHTRIKGTRTNARHLPIGSIGISNVEPQIYTDQQSIINNNLNNVDIEVEMARLAKNQITYNTLIQQVNHELRQIRTAIGGN